MAENKPVLIALALVGVLLLGVAIYYFNSSETGEDVTVMVPVPEPAPVPEPEPEETPPPIVVEKPPELPEPTPEPEPTFVLPKLDNSDQLIRDGVVSLTRHEGINGWLGSTELVRRFVVSVDNIANGTIAREAVASLAPTGEMSVTAVSEDVYVLNEVSYERFNTATSILQSIDTERAVEFYVLLKPLFQQAYDELGYPGTSFEDSLLQGIGRLLETPDLDGPVRLVRPVVLYEYEDPALESLSPAQKQLLRMGPKNARAVKKKLSEIARELRSVLER